MKQLQRSPKRAEEKERDKTSQETEKEVDTMKRRFQRGADEFIEVVKEDTMEKKKKR